MSFTEKFRYTAGQTDLYAYPADAAYAFSGWATHRVLCTEIAAGLYSATLDETKSYEWSVFDGSTAPTTHDDAIVAITYDPPAVTTGTGARTVTLTVTLSSSPVQGAKVRISKDAESYSGETNSSGQIVFNVNDGTWAVAITHPGTSFSGASLVVDGTEAATYALTAATIPASSSPSTATGYLYRYGNSNSVQPGIQFCVLLTAGPGTAGQSFDPAIRTVTSDSSGQVAFTELVRGATYKLWSGFKGNSDDAVTFTVPATGASFTLPEVL